MPIRKPIKDAPKDGTVITLYRDLGMGRYDKRLKCVWVNGHWVDLRTGRPVPWRPHSWTLHHKAAKTPKPKKEIVIFGNSPFLANVDMDRLLERHTTLGINHVVQRYACDFGLSYHGVMPGSKAKHHITVPQYDDGRPGLEIIHTLPSYTPIVKPKYKKGHLVVGWRMYSVAIAVNWAILKDYTDMYLVGVDHKETDGPFIHHIGDVGTNMETEDKRRGVKSFIGNCLFHARVYQCNPDVAGEWDLPYKDITELYE